MIFTPKCWCQHGCCWILEDWKAHDQKNLVLNCVFKLSWFFCCIKRTERDSILRSQHPSYSSLLSVWCSRMLIYSVLLCFDIVSVYNLHVARKRDVVLYASNRWQASCCKVCYIHYIWRMPSSGMSRRVAVIRTDVSEDHITSIIRVTKIGKLYISSQPASIASCC
jgi:hypothetical protein